MPSPAPSRRRSDRADELIRAAETNAIDWEPAPDGFLWFGNASLR